MEIRLKNKEILFYILAFLLAIVLRIYHLGIVPLTDAEAYWALQALNIAHPNGPSYAVMIGNQIAYVNLTGTIFYILFDNNFLARVLPAFIGSFLVWLPFLFKNKLGRTAAIFAAFGLAIDAGLVVTSRTIGSPILAITFGFFAFAFYCIKKPILVGMLIGLTLLSGTFGIILALVFGLSWVTINQFNKKQFSKNALEQEKKNTAQVNNGISRFTKEQWIVLGISFGGTILVVGSIFFVYPQGISAIFDTLPSFVKGWVEPSGVSPIQIIIALLFYAPLPLAFSAYQIIVLILRKSKSDTPINTIDKYLVTFSLIALILIIIYPGRETSYLTLVLIPLWLLAGQGLQNSIKEWKITGITTAHSIFIFIIMALFWFSLISHTTLVVITEPYLPLLKATVLLGIILIGIFSTILISMGWGTNTARNGVILGSLIGLFVYTFSVMWGASQLRPTHPEELWFTQPGSGQTNLFLKTLSDLSNWNSGLPQSIEILSLVDTPSMKWALRQFDNAHFENAVSPVSLPPIILTLETEDAPILPSTYRGQDFVWWIRAGWTGALPSDFIAWLTFRDAPLINEKIILWAREDMFPKGGEIFIEPQAPSPEFE